MFRDKLLPLSALLFGVGGCSLNHQLHTVGVDSETLLLASTSYPTLLLVTTALVVVVMLLGVLRGTSHQGALQNLGSPTGFALVLWRLGASTLSVGAGLGLGTVIQQMRQWSEGYGVSFPVVPVVGCIIGLMGSIGMLTVVKYLSKGECPQKLGTMTTLMAFVPLPWLLYCYQENTRNPVITLYAYQLLGLSAAAIALYLTATFFYGKSSPKMTVLFSLVGGYLLVTSMCLDQSIYLNVNQVALALVLLGNASAILNNMGRPIQTFNEQEGTETI